MTSDKTIDLKMFLYCLYFRNCTSRAVARPQHVAITACDWTLNLAVILKIQVIFDMF